MIIATHEMSFAREVARQDLLPRRRRHLRGGHARRDLLRAARGADARVPRPRARGGPAVSRLPRRVEGAARRRGDPGPAALLRRADGVLARSSTSRRSTRRREGRRHARRPDEGHLGTIYLSRSRLAIGIVLVGLLATLLRSRLAVIVPPSRASPRSSCSSRSTPGRRSTRALSARSRQHPAEAARTSRLRGEWERARRPPPARSGSWRSGSRSPRSCSPSCSTCTGAGHGAPLPPSRPARPTSPSSISSSDSDLVRGGRPGRGAG